MDASTLADDKTVLSAPTIAYAFVYSMKNSVQESHFHTSLLLYLPVLSALLFSVVVLRRTALNVLRS